MRTVYTQYYQRYLPVGKYGNSYAIRTHVCPLRTRRERFEFSTSLCRSFLLPVKTLTDAGHLYNISTGILNHYKIQK